MNRTSSIGFGSLRNIFHATKLIDDPPRGVLRTNPSAKEDEVSRYEQPWGFFWTAEILRKNPTGAQGLTSTKCANDI